MGGIYSRCQTQSSFIESSDSGEEISHLIDPAKVSPFYLGKTKFARKKRQDGNFPKHRKPRVKDQSGKIFIQRSSTPVKGDMDSLKTKTLEIFAKIPSYKLSGNNESNVKKISFVTKDHLENCEEETTERKHLHDYNKGHFNRQKKYIKNSPQPMNFFSLLDFEINEQMLNSVQIVKKLSPACEFLREHIQTIAQTVFNGTFNIMERIDNKIIVVLYGSMATGFAYDESDADFAILGLQVTTKESLDYQIDLLSKKFLTDPLVIECKAIPSARVPIIKLVSISIFFN